ncbi:hypothetical protein KQY10_00595, partial [Leptospira interrogans]|uniref:hypothetical protein n=1 Tax=Leptospira interrogans TaxID=173 RepID=UPI001E3CAD06
MNKVLFFGKAGVPTFYPFVPFVQRNCDQNKSSPHLNRLPASKLYSEEKLEGFVSVSWVLNAYRHQSYIQGNLLEFYTWLVRVLNAYRHQSYIQLYIKHQKFFY